MVDTGEIKGENFKEDDHTLDTHEKRHWGTCNNLLEYKKIRLVTYKHLCYLVDIIHLLN